MDRHFLFYVWLSGVYSNAKTLKFLFSLRFLPLRIITRPLSKLRLTLSLPSLLFQLRHPAVFLVESLIPDFENFILQFLHPCVPFFIAIWIDQFSIIACFFFFLRSFVFFRFLRFFRFPRVRSSRSRATDSRSLIYTHKYMKICLVTATAIQSAVQEPPIKPKTERDI